MKRFYSKLNAGKRLFLSLLMFCPIAWVQSIAQRVTLDDASQRLWLCMSNMPSGFAQMHKAAKTPNVPYFSLGEIDPDKSGRVNKASLRKALDKAIPSKSYDGLLVLDWEGEDFNVLKFNKPIVAEAYEKSVQKFIDLIEYTRTLRPKAQIGVWDIPLSVYFVKVDTTWRRRNDLIDRIYPHCDVLMPSLYDIYPTGSVAWQDDTTYMTEVLKVSLENGIKHNKPVLPFIWHRYSDAVAESALYSIEPDEFRRQIKFMSEFEYRGRKINGVIWWQEDLYYLNIKSPHMMEEVAGNDILSYREQNLKKYWDILRDIYR